MPRHRRSPRCRVAMLCLALLGALSPALLAATPSPLNELEKRGRRIYLEGVGQDEIIARLGGEPGVDVPASTLPCGGCHGRDGQGRPEGGIAPSNLTWETLTRPYEVVGANGRRHPPYTESFLKRAITMGLDPAGNQLHVAMPRYMMTLDDMAALIAYLQRLGNEPQPGVADRSLRLATILPPGGRLESLGNAIEQVIAAGLQEVNEQGGVYGRQLELRSLQLPAEQDAWGEKVTGFLAAEQPFALVGAFIAGGEAELVTLLGEAAVPLVGPFTLYPRTDFPLHREVFYLLAGIAEQSRVLLRWRGDKPATVVVPADDDKLAEVVEKLIASSPPGAVATRSYRAPLTAEVAGELARETSTAVLFLGQDADLTTLLGEATHLSWAGDVLVPGQLSGQSALAVPADFAGRVVVSFPTLPVDHTPPGLAEMRRLAEKHDLSAAHRSTQLATLGAVKVLVEGLRRAGRDLTREKLISELEGFLKLQTGVLPPLTFNANRRIGSTGSYVVVTHPVADGAAPQPRWVALDD